MQDKEMIGLKGGAYRRARNLQTARNLRSGCQRPRNRKSPSGLGRLPGSRKAVERRSGLTLTLRPSRGGLHGGGRCLKIVGNSAQITLSSC